VLISASKLEQRPIDLLSKQPRKSKKTTSDWLLTLHIIILGADADGIKFGKITSKQVFLLVF
jgi:hypothetical protein